jgi:mannitol/fructose-specific phosphotransferase system IIA component (Ntr-type)
MKITEFVKKSAIVHQLISSTRDEAITELVQALQQTGAFEAAYTGDVLAAVMRREQLGSTGIGRGIAIPHSRHSSVAQLAGVLGVSHHPSGIAFEAIDDAPVSVMVLMISPQDQPGLHLRALDCVVQTFKDDQTLAKVKASTNSEEIWALLGGS